MGHMQWAQALMTGLFLHFARVLQHLGCVHKHVHVRSVMVQAVPHKQKKLNALA